MGGWVGGMHAEAGGSPTWEPTGLQVVAAVLGRAGRAQRWDVGLCFPSCMLNEEIGSGLAADGRGRWAVESILAWRGGAGDRAALVRWSGFDPATGEPWADSWEPRAALNSDLRGGGLIRRRRTAAEIREEERRAREDWDERHTHTRKSRRLQGRAFLISR